MLVIPFSLGLSLVNFQVSVYLSEYKKLCQNDIDCSLAAIQSASEALSRTPIERFVNINGYISLTISQIYEQTPDVPVMKAAIKALQKCATIGKPSASSKPCDEAIKRITNLP